MLNNLNNICYMHVNFYKRPQIQFNNSHSKIENSTLFLEYLGEFIEIQLREESKDLVLLDWLIILLEPINRFIGSLKNMSWRNLSNYFWPESIKISLSHSPDF